MEPVIPLPSAMMATSPPTPERDRLTASLKVYKETFGENPEMIDVGFCQLMKTVGEDVYSRKVTVGDAWESVDGGFVDKPGLCIIENVGTVRRANPTDGEKADDVTKVVEIIDASLTGVQIIIQPKRFLMMEVAVFSDLRIRCQNGSTKIRLTLLPR